MSHEQNTQWIEMMNENLEQALTEGDFPVAQEIMQAVEKNGFNIKEMKSKYACALDLMKLENEITDYV